MEKNTNKKYAGIIVKIDGMYYFSNKRGKLFNLPQTDEVRELCERKSLCVFEAASCNMEDFTFGHIVEVVGNSGDPIPEGVAIAKSYDLIREPSKEVMNEVDAIPQEVTSAQRKNIADLRDIPFITIDPDSAKDFDDAVFACKNPDGTYTLKVAIANVANYISPNSALFKYAIDAGNSSYLGNVCYPMLVEELSNGICSLNEKVDRLVFCTTCTINSRGEILDYTIEPGVINSKHRLTYKEADYLYFGENHPGDEADHSNLKKKTADVTDSLSCLYDVANILYAARMRRGAFDIDAKKLSFKLDPTGTKVVKYEKDHDEVFTSVIEETAIITNEIWGEIAQNFNIPFFFRNHKQIEREKLYELRNKLSQFGISLPRSVRSKDLQEVIEKVKGKRIEEYIVTTILKAMEAAFYDVDNIGHAGLAITPNEFKSFQQLTKQRQMTRTDAADEARSKYFMKTGRSNGLSFEGNITHSAYAQSTSPIRRGSDLFNQMQMLEYVNNGHFMFRTNDLIEYSNTLNFCEKNSDMAENEYNDMLSAKWAIENIGKVFYNCTVVAIGENSAKIVTPDGYRMYLPFDQTGIRKKFLKIGTKIARVAIDSVTMCPPRVLGRRAVSKELEQEDTTMC